MNVQTTLLLIGLCATPASHAEKPIWAKQAVPLELKCGSPQTISSPNRLADVQILCTTRTNDDPSFSIRLNLSNGRHFGAPLRRGVHELLWSPDSKSFFVNGGETAIAGFFVSVYRLGEGKLEQLNITQAAQMDMVHSFPPCKALNRDASACHRIEEDPQFNMSGIAWTADSQAIEVFAEIPCSGSYGGILCSVKGYKLSVPSGRIMERLSAALVKKQWQSAMAWQMTVPDAPVYGKANETF